MNTLASRTGALRSLYTWDVRNHLVAIGGAVSASFQYDPLGRRVSKTIGAATTNFLYDGANPVQELSGGSPTANLLTGLGIDEYFQRTDANGPANFLTDGLGSTIALTGTGGNTIAQYTYDPYGNTTMTGNSANPYQYTGRENDGTGLYYDRVRYYNPTLQRFISEDPIGMAGGIDLYAYVGNNPISFRDPFGTCPADGEGTCKSSSSGPENPPPHGGAKGSNADCYSGKYLRSPNSIPYSVVFM
ncbi:MAG: RHS repeat-associated core domain-containing protein [Terriglobia bacterium]